MKSPGNRFQSPCNEACMTRVRSPHLQAPKDKVKPKCQAYSAYPREQWLEKAHCPERSRFKHHTYVTRHQIKNWQNRSCLKTHRYARMPSSPIRGECRADSLRCRRSVRTTRQKRPLAESTKATIKVRAIALTCRYNYVTGL